MNIKIMSLNVQHCKNYITKKIDYKSISDLINKYKPDIIGLNEVYKFQLKKIIKNTDYKYYFGKSTMLLPYGNALITKYPINNIKIIKIPNKYYEGRSIIDSQLIVNNRILNVYITHLGLNTNEQINEINILNKIIKMDNSIIMGDFNMNKDNKLIKSLYNNYIEVFNDKLDINTYPSDNPKEKLDYIFVSKNIEIISSKVTDEIVSDHKAIITKIKH